MNGDSSRRRVAVIFNPNSGPHRWNGASRRRRLLAAALSSVAVEWVETTEHEPGSQATRRALARGVDLVLACGGDGTVMACASALVGSSIPLAIVPGGTGNIIAASLQIPRTADRAVAVALGGRRKSLDVCTSHDDRLFFAGSVGVSAAIMKDASPALKNRFGMIAYVLSTARHLLDETRDYQIVLPGGAEIHRRAHGVLVGNYAGLIRSTRFPSAALDDGLIEVGILRLRPLRAWLPGRRSADAVLRPPLEWLQVEQVEVYCKRPDLVENNGEPCGRLQSLTVSVRPRALTVCVPSLGPDLRPKPLLSMALRDLLLVPVRTLAFLCRSKTPAAEGSDIARRSPRES
jgi:diacylglycerol kinase (ATP)